MATGLTFPTLNECVSPYQLIVALNDFFAQLTSSSTINFDTFVTSGSFNGSTLFLSNNTGNTFTVSGFVDTVVTAGTYDNTSSLITFTNNSGGTFQTSLSAITNTLSAATSSLSDDFTTAGTYNNATSIITFTRQSGGTFDVSLSSITNELYALSAKTSFDVTTGATFNTGNGNLVFNTYTGGTYNVSLSAALQDIYVTGATYNSATTFLTMSNNSGGTFVASLSSLTHNDYVTGATYNSGTSVLTLTRLSGGTVTVNLGQNNTDDYVVSGAYDSGTSILTLTRLSGGTVQVTGVTQSDRYAVSGTVIGSLLQIIGNDGYNFVVDISTLAGGQSVTGGTFVYSAETATFTNSSGGTFTVTGFTDNFVTGGTFVQSANTINLTDKLNNTISITGVAGSPVLAVSGGTNISTGGTQQYPIVNMDSYIMLSGLTATTINAPNFSLGSGNAVSFSATNFFSGSTPFQTILESFDTNISGGSINGNLLTLSGADSGTVVISGIPVVTDTTLSGGTFTYNPLGGTLTLSGSQGIFNVTGFTDSFFTGSSLSNLGILQLSGTQGVISVDLSPLSADTNVSGGSVTYASNAGTLQLSGSASGVFNVTGITNDFISGASLSSLAVLSMSGTQGIFNVDLAVLSATTDTNLTGGSISNLGILQLSGSQGIFSVDISSLSGDTNITGGSLNNAGVLQLSGAAAGVFNISGFSSNGVLAVSGGTNIFTSGTQPYPIINTVASPSFNNLNASGLTTMSTAHTAVFSANTASAKTLWVTSISGMSPVGINGIIVENDGITANTVTANTAYLGEIFSGVTPLGVIIERFDNYVTGFTYSGAISSFVIGDRDGVQFVQHFSPVFAVSGGSNVSTGGTQQNPIININSYLQLSGLTATTINVPVLNAGSAFTQVISAGTIYSGSTPLEQVLELFDTNVSGGNITNGTLTLSGADSGIVTITGFSTTSDTNVSGGSVNNLGVLQLSGSQGLVNIDISSLSGDTNVSGGSYNGTSGTLTLSGAQSGVFNITGWTDNSVTGGSISNLGVLQLSGAQGLTNIDISSLSGDTNVSGGSVSYAGPAGTLQLSGAQSGVFNITGLQNDYVSAASLSNLAVLSLSGSQGIFNVNLAGLSGETTDTNISGGVLTNLANLQLSGATAGILNISLSGLSGNPGWDDVLSVGQAQTAARAVDGGGFNLFQSNFAQLQHRGNGSYLNRFNRISLDATGLTFQATSASAATITGGDTGVSLNSSVYGNSVLIGTGISLTIGSNKALEISGISTNWYTGNTHNYSGTFGTFGQVLISQGNGMSPAWATIATSDNFVSGGSFSNGTLQLSGTQGIINITGITSDTNISGGSISNLGVLQLSGATAGIVNIDISSLSGDTNVSGGSVTYASNAGTIQLSGAASGVFNVTGLSNDFISGASLSNLAVLSMSGTQGIFNVDLVSLSANTNVSGGSISNLGVLQLSGSQGLTNIDISSLSGDTNISGGSFASGTLQLSGAQSGVFNVTGFTSDNFYVTGGSVSYAGPAGTLQLSGAQGLVNITGFTNDFVSGASLSNLAVLSMSGSQGIFNVDLASLSADTNVSGGSISNLGVLQLSGSQGIFNVDISSLSGDTNVSGGSITYAGPTGTLQLSGSQGIFNVTGVTNDYISGASFNSASQTITLSGSQGLVTITGISSTDTNVTGGSISYASNAGTLQLSGAQSGVFNVTGVTNDYVSGASLTNLSVLQLSGTQGIINVDLVSLSADTNVSGGSFSTTDILQLSGAQSGVLSITGITWSPVRAVSGGTNISTGGTQQFPIVDLDPYIQISGLTANTATVFSLSGGNVLINSLSALTVTANTVSANTFTANTGQINVFSSVTMTATTGLFSGTLSAVSVSAMTLLATNASAATMQSDSYFSAGTPLATIIELFDNYITGGTFNTGTSVITLSDIDGNTINITGVTDNTNISGGTISGSSLILSGSHAGVLVITGLTENPVFAVSGGTGINTGGTQAYPIVNLDPYLWISGLTANTAIVSQSYSATSVIYSPSLTATTLSAGTLYSGGTELSTIIEQFDTYVTGGTFDSNTSIITFNNNDGNSFTVTGVSSNTNLTGGTYTATTSNAYSSTNAISLSGSEGVFSVGNIVDSNLYVTGGTYSAASQTITFSNTSGGTFDVTGIGAIQVTAGTFSSSTLTLFDDAGGVVTVTGVTAEIITGGTFSGSTLVLDGDQGTVITITGVTPETITGGTLSAGTITFEGDQGTTFQITGVTDTNVSGGSFSTTDVLQLSGAAGGIFDVTGITWSPVRAVSGGTNILTGGTQQYPIVSLSGSITVDSISSTTVSAGTYYSGSTPLETVIYSIANPSTIVTDTRNYVANVTQTITHALSSTSIHVQLVDTNTNTKITDVLVDNYQDQSVDITLGQNVDNVKTLIVGATSAFSIDLGVLASAFTVTSVSAGRNITLGGTSSDPVINTTLDVGFNNLVASGTSQLNTTTSASISATTVTGHTVWTSAISGLSPVAINGVLVDDSGISGNTLSAGTISANTIYSGVAGGPYFDLYDVFSGGSGGGSANNLFGADDTLAATRTHALAGFSFNMNSTTNNVEFNAAYLKSTIFRVDDGGSNALQVSYDGTNNYGVLDYDTNSAGEDLVIKYQSNANPQARFNAAGSVTLGHATDTRFETQSTGGTLHDNWTILNTNSRGNGLTGGSIVYSSTTFDDAAVTELLELSKGSELFYNAAGSTTTASLIYYLSSAGVWTAAVNTAASTSTSMLGVATSTNSDSGMLIKGSILMNSSFVGGTAVVGAPIYLTNSAGRYTFTEPTTSGQIIRIVGYYTGAVVIGRGTAYKIFINPDQSWTVAP